MTEVIGIFVRDETEGRRWLVAVGKRKPVERLFDWCCANLGGPGTGWFSILNEDNDAYFIELHFQAEPSYQSFEKRFRAFYLPNQFDSLLEYEPDFEQLQYSG